MQVSSDVVEAILCSLDEHKSTGPDELYPKILKILARFIAKPLAHLFDLSLATGQVPNDWRTATVCPIFKKGSREIQGDYHPVSLTSIVCKMLESILKQSIMHHLQRTEAILNSQHGYLPKKSCLTNLLAMEKKNSLNSWIMAIPWIWFSSTTLKPSLLLTIVFLFRNLKLMAFMIKS